VNLKIFN